MTGRAGVVQDLGSFILPRLKRLITEQGIFGNNRDVLPDLPGGYRGAGSGGGEFLRANDEEIAGAELRLDVAIFEDGLCVGPDESNLYEILMEELDRQRSVAQDIVAALHNGASVGQVFEILQPLARHVPSASPRSMLLPIFANMAIHQLIKADDSELPAWFEPAAQASPVRLHRPQ